jgi:hypothetical protein
MSATVLQFPRRKKVPPRYPKPRQRVFYAGHRYVGPQLCQDVQQVYLKRHGDGEWSLIFYADGSSWEIDRFPSNDVPFKFEEHGIEFAPSYSELEEMGWQDPTGENVTEMAYYRLVGFK